MASWTIQATEAAPRYTSNLYVVYDFRHPSDLTTAPSVVLQPGLISQANGSAYIETERMKIACAVYVHNATTQQRLGG